MGVTRFFSVNSLWVTYLENGLELRNQTLTTKLIAPLLQRPQRRHGLLRLSSAGARALELLLPMQVREP